MRRLIVVRTVVAVITCGAVMGAGVVGATAATSPAAVSALAFRSDATDLVREPAIDGSTLGVGIGTMIYGSTSTPYMGFGSTLGSGSGSVVNVELSVGLLPGTYQTTRVPTHGNALLDTSVGTCGDLRPGVLHVVQASYDSAGKPTVFAASYELPSCDGDGTRTLHGEIRWHSTVALGLLIAPAAVATAAAVQVNSSADVTVSMRAAGNVATSVGRVSLAEHNIYDPATYWSLIHDRCSYRVIAPGSSCTVTVRVSPKRTTSGSHATLTVPDGQPYAAHAGVSTAIDPLPDQVIGLVADGAYRHVNLRWGAVPYHGQITTYRVDRIDPGGVLTPIGTTDQTRLTVPDLPDHDTATYVVAIDSVGATPYPGAPESVPASATTSTRELLYASDQDGLYNQQLAPVPAPATLFDSQNVHGANAAIHALNVSNDESTMTWATDDYQQSHGGISVASVDGAVTGYSSWNDAPDGVMPWDTDPALNAVGTQVVYARATAPDSASTVLRIAATAADSTATDVPNSAGLSDPVFTIDGSAIIAVADADTTPHLVRLDLSTSQLTAIDGTTGVSEPDITSDGRIVGIEKTDPQHPDASELVICTTGTCTPIPGAIDGANWRPHFSPNGQSILYTRRADLGGSVEYSGNGAMIDIASGTITDLTSLPAGSPQTPYLINGDPTVDATPPTVAQVHLPASVTTQDSILATWTGTDPTVSGHATTGIASYDLRYRQANPGEPFVSWVYPPANQDTVTASARLDLAPGTEYCFSARGHDHAGNTSAWTTPACVTTPLDDRSLTTAARRLTSTSYYRGTYSKAAAATTFTRRDVNARYVALLVRTCPTCGKLSVTLAGHYLGTINTHATTTRYKRVLWLPSTATLHGTLILKTISSTVYLDGIFAIQ